MLKLKTLLIPVLLATSMGIANASDVIEKTVLTGGGEGVKDWGSGYFEVTGRATADAEPYWLN